MIGGASVQGGYRRALAPFAVAAAGLALIAALVWPSAAQAVTIDVSQNTDAEIVYLDPDGMIRVVDPRPGSSALQVRWTSPDGGWTHIVLADVNGDGDAEIVAVRPEGDAGRLTIFDPVLAEIPDDHERFEGGIAWDILYSELLLLGAPRLVITGEFAPDRPGVEILVSHFLPEEERSNSRHQSRVLVLRPESGSTDGRKWEVMTRYDSEPDWTWGASGDVDGDGKGEVALIDDRAGDLSVFRVGESLALLFRNVTSGNVWRQAAFGQFTGGGGEELVAVRGASLPLASFWVFRYENNTMVDHRWEAFLPSPHVVFLGDLDGDSDVEAIMLRNVRPELGARPRLIVRDSGADPLRFEVLLDGDNGYQSGAAGDIDGDGRDEIAIMRDSRIRIYTQPETDSTFEEILTPTNAQVIQMGNVDANGVTLAVSASPEVVAFTYYPCIADPGTRSATVALEGLEGVAFTAVLDGNPAWASVTPVSGQLPGSVRVTVNPDFRDDDWVETELVLTFDLDDAREVELSVPVAALCARSRLLLPFVGTVTP